MNERISAKIANGGIIAAAMVVGIHVCRAEHVGSFLWWWDQITHWGVFLIAVPYFFVCSGYFLCRHYVGVRDGHGAGGDSLLGVWRGEMWKRVKSLLVPFLIWSAIGLCVFEVLPVRIAANALHGRDLLSNVPEGWRFWADAFGTYPYKYPMVAPLWYVRALLIFTVISPFIFKLMKKWGGENMYRHLHFLGDIWNETWN